MKTENEQKDFLAQIQAEIKAPKGQFNSFGKYKYRSCEDILEAVKPIIHPLGFALIIEDEIVLIGDRYYVKATSSLSNGTILYTATGYAREDLEKKGMDACQVTGSASSYARKYSLNGLFAIDDTKDSDATNECKELPTKPTVTPPQKELVDAINEISNAKTLDEVKAIWLSFNKFQSNQNFLNAKEAQKIKLTIQK